jgi:hypothetical protein
MMAVLLDDAFDQYVVTSPITALASTATISFWIKTTYVGGANPFTEACVVGFEVGGSSVDIFWGTISSAGTIGMAKGNTRVLSTTAINDDQWHHVLITWNDSTGAVQVFVDGDLETSGTTGTGTVGTSLLNGIGRMNINSGTGQIYLPGSLADVRVYSRILSAGEAQTIFAANGHDGIVDGMTIRWTMDDENEGTAVSTVIDRSDSPNDGSNSGLPSAGPFGVETFSALQVFGVDQFAAGPNRIDLDTAEGDQTAVFVTGRVFVVAGATNPANDGTYTVSSSSFTGGETRISVNESVSTNESGSAATATTENRIDLEAAEGDLTATFPAGAFFSVSGATSPANNGTYTVASSVFAGGETQIFPNETVSVDELTASPATITRTDTIPLHDESPLDSRRKLA